MLYQACPAILHSLSPGLQNIKVIPGPLILDEPCQGLDMVHRRPSIALVDRTFGQTPTSHIFVTHQSPEMPACITHVLELKPGCIHRHRKKRVERRLPHGRLLP